MNYGGKRPISFVSYALGTLIIYLPQQALDSALTSEYS